MRAQLLPDYAREAAEHAMEQYKGVLIDCEYLGVRVGDHNAMEGAKYIKHPLDWPKLEGGDRSSQRRVYAKWTVHMSDDKSGNTLWDKEYPGTLNHILDRDHTFPQPAELYTTWANIRMTQKAREDPHAPCVFERLITSTGGDRYAEFAWTGVYTDESLQHPYRSRVLLEDMLRKDCRCVPWNPVTANNADGLTFTVDFYDQLARKLNMRFAGVPVPRDGSAKPWLEYRAPRQLDTDCMWVLKSGRAVSRPAGDIVMYDARLKLFGNDVNQSLEEHADEIYNGTFAFRRRGIGDVAHRGSLRKHMQTVVGRYRIACKRYRYFGFLGVPQDIAEFDRIRQTNPTLQSEPWSVTTWVTPSDDCVPCWWIVNAALEEAQVCSIMQCCFLSLLVYLCTIYLYVTDEVCVSNAGRAEANGLYTCGGIHNGEPAYRRACGAIIFWICKTLDAWCLVQHDGCMQELLYKCVYRRSGHEGLDHGKLPLGRWLGSNGEALCHIAYEYKKKARYAHHSMFASACPTAIIYAQDCQMRILAYRRPSVAV